MKANNVNDKSHLPDPPIGGDVDLRDLSSMPLDVRRLRDADMAIAADANLYFRHAVLLWCASWHQIPAGSLPNNDAVLMQLAGAGQGRAAHRNWLGIRDRALRGFELCNDGRLYHHFIVKMALAAWHKTDPASKSETGAHIQYSGAKPKPRGGPSKDEEETAIRVLEFLNQHTSSHFRAVTPNVKFVVDRLREGYVEDDLRAVIIKKTAEWKDDADMCKYLRPSTLFNREKFSQYVGQ